METRARYAIIGAFTLVVIVLAFGFIYWLKRLDETGLRSTIYFEFHGTVGGLAPGGAVYFAGIKVGNVAALAFDPNDPNKVLVTADVRVDTPIKVDSHAEVGSNLLTGVAYVDMSGGSPDAASLFDESPPKIVGSQSALSDVIGTASNTLNNVNEIVTRVDAFLAQNEESVTKTTKNIQSFTDALAENSSGVKDFLANVAKMSQTVSDLSEKLTAIVEKADTIVAAVDPEHVSSVVENADRLVKGIADSTTDIQDITAKAKTIADDLKDFSSGLKTTLGNVQEVVDKIDAEKVAAAIDNVSAFSDKLKSAAPDIDTLVGDAKATVANTKDVTEQANQFVTNLNTHSEDVNKIVANVRDLSDRLKGTSDKLDTLLTKANDFLGGTSGEEGKNFFQEAAAAAKSIHEVADKINSSSGQIVGGVTRFSTRGLDDISALVKDLRATAARIDRAVAEFSQNPTGAVFGGNSNVREYNRR
jgi:phospholipid/cholesterol/gamma-HCH transport system substrate-binding protein